MTPFDAMKTMRHPDWYEDWPQSGERIPSHEAYQAIHENFPGGMPEIDLQQVAGAEDRWVMTPSMTIQRIAGSGDVWFRATSVHNGTDDEELWYVAGAQSIPTSGKITIKTALSRAIAATVVELQGIATGASLDVTATSSGVSASPSIGPSAATIDANEIAIGDTGVTEPDALRESDQTRRGDLQTPLTGIPMQRESISPAEQHYLAAHPVNPDDPT